MENEPLYIEAFNYPLEDERIAKYPLPERDHSKLLLYKQGQISEDIFYNIGKHLPDKALLVYNNTKVIQARLIFHKPTGARIEIFCLEPLDPHDYSLSLSSTNSCEWKCLVGNLKKWKDNHISMPIGNNRMLIAERLESQGNTHRIRFSWNDETLSFAEILEQLGELPIPPYLNRATEENDKRTYQTVYSKIKGSVAAPTAGLHFTDKVLDGLRKNGISMTEVTLHVGAGTFQPVKVEDANQHTMHTETIAVERKAIEEIRNHLGNIIAVGTTSVRTLESLYFLGCIDWEEELPTVSQFAPYLNTFTETPDEALDKLLDKMSKLHMETLHASTQIMIKPGYVFRIVDGMITNFHQPKSTLLLLVSAFIGKDWEKVYQYALNHGFRFLSYGDSSLLLPQADKPLSK